MASNVEDVADETRHDAVAHLEQRIAHLEAALVVARVIVAELRIMAGGSVSTLSGRFRTLEELAEAFKRADHLNFGVRP